MCHHKKSRLFLLGLGHMGLLLVPELAPAILVQVVFLSAVRALDWLVINRLLLLLPFFSARMPTRFSLLLVAFATKGLVALAGVVGEL